MGLRPNIFILERYELNSTIGYRNSFRKQNQCLTPAFMVYKIKKYSPGIKVNAVLKQAELDSFILFRLVIKFLKFSELCCAVQTAVSKVDDFHELSCCEYWLFETKSVLQTTKELPQSFNKPSPIDKKIRD